MSGHECAVGGTGGDPVVARCRICSVALCKAHLVAADRSTSPASLDACAHRPGARPAARQRSATPIAV